EARHETPPRQPAPARAPGRRACANASEVLQLPTLLVERLRFAHGKDSTLFRVTHNHGSCADHAFRGDVHRIAECCVHTYEARLADRDVAGDDRMRGDEAVVADDRVVADVVPAPEDHVVAEAD